MIVGRSFLRLTSGTSAGESIFNPSVPDVGKLNPNVFAENKYSVTSVDFYN